MSTQNRATPEGQSLAWALISSALFVGWLYYVGGWILALSGLVGVLVHEYGHYLAINKAGLGPSRIYLVPFFGGMATQPRRAPDEMTDVVISLAGPALGAAASIPFFILHLIDGDRIWLEGAFVIGIINLFNLLPAPPLDGSKALGPIFARVHPQLERYVAIAIGVVAILWLASRGSIVLPAFIGIALIPIFQGRPMREPSEPLNSGDARRALILYLLALTLCLGVIFAVGYAAGISNPFVLLLEYFG